LWIAPFVVGFFFSLFRGSLSYLAFLKSLPTLPSLGAPFLTLDVIFGVTVRPFLGAFCLGFFFLPRRVLFRAVDLLSIPLADFVDPLLSSADSPSPLFPPCRPSQQVSNSPFFFLKPGSLITHCSPLPSFTLAVWVPGVYTPPPPSGSLSGPGVSSSSFFFDTPPCDTRLWPREPPYLPFRFFVSPRTPA